MPPNSVRFLAVFRSILGSRFPNHCFLNPVWLMATPAHTGADATGLRWPSNSTRLIRRQRKDDPNNASGSASGYRTNMHTHTRTHYLRFCPPVETPGSRHTRHPRLLLGKNWQRSFRNRKTVGSDLRKQASVCFPACAQPPSLFSVLSNRWRAPRLRGPTASALPNRAASAGPTIAESCRSPCCTTPEDSRSLGRWERRRLPIALLARG